MKILTVYPFASLCPSEFITYLKKFSQGNKIKIKILLIIGDLNIDLMNYSSIREEYLNG